ncbi:MAG: GNAT family N-acetyltransferase [Streptosporangiaceae bacterium]
MHDSLPRPAGTLEHGPAILRRWQAGDEDAAYLSVIESQAHLRPWMPWAATYTRQNAAEFVAACERDWWYGTAYHYAITAEGQIAGSCGLMARIGPGGLEIGYWVHQACVRRGLATAAAAALTDAAFRLPGIDYVEIVHDELNEASAAVPRKLGFTEIGPRPLDVTPEAGTGLGIVWRLTRPDAPGPVGPASPSLPPA